MSEMTERELKDIGKKWARAKAAERNAATKAYALIKYAAEVQGVPETTIAQLVGVDRMTVRRALGKL
jgi:DNA-binding GntR family transcriptional regulator